MELINNKTGETIRENLTPQDVRVLYDRGVESLVGNDAETADGSGAGDIVPTDLDLGTDGDATGSGTDQTDDPSDADDASDLDADDVQDAIDAMEQADRERSSADWHGVSDDTYTDADENEQRRYERLQRRIGENQTDLAQRKTERDDLTTGPHMYSADDIRDELRESGIADDVERAFREIKTQDVPEPADDGADIYVDGYVRHLAGDYSETEFYLEHKPVETGDRVVGVALDMSGSVKEQTAKVAFGALYIATNSIGDDLVASAFYTEHRSKKPKTQLITAPNESFEWEHLNAVKPKNYTPTTKGVTDVRNLLQKTTAREKVMLVVTDGMANITQRERKHAYTAKREASDAINAVRAEGIKVIGFGVDDVDDDDMTDVFGSEGYVMADWDNMAQKLVEVYRQQMTV